MGNGNNPNWLNETFANRPFIVGGLFLGTYFVPFLVLIGVALAYVFRRNPVEDWESSHFVYLIRTFWIAVLGALLTLALSGLGVFAWDRFGRALDSDDVIFYLIVPLAVVLIPLLVFCGVRVVLSLMRSAAHTPMPKPDSWLL